MSQFSDEQFWEVHELIGHDPQKALKLVRKYMEEGLEDMKFLTVQNGWLIDIGAAIGDVGLVETAVQNLEELTKNLPEELKETFLCGWLYDLGNGYSTLARLKKDETAIFKKDSYTRKAKHTLRSAIEAYKYDNKDKLADMRVNYANCLSSLGRTVEAIQEYKNVLKNYPDHPVAKGNLALELEQFSFISGDPHLMDDSISLLEEALEGSIESFGVHGARQYYSDGLQRLKQKKQDYEKRFGKCSCGESAPTEQDNDFITKYSSFCEENNLFLALTTPKHGKQQQRDTILPSGVIVPLMDEVRLPTILRPINEMKERYATARLLLFEACNPPVSISDLNDMTIYAENLDYSAYGVHVGKMKLVLESSFNILDKIALFLKRYLELPRREDRLYFRNLWYVEDSKGRVDFNTLSSDIQGTNSYRLAGLFDLALDISKDPRIARLQEMRHLSTHRYLLPHYEFIRPITEADGEEYHTDYFTLAEDCIAALQLARSAIIYLTAFVDEAERAKKVPDRLIAPMPQPPYKHYDISPL